MRRKDVPIRVLLVLVIALLTQLWLCPSDAAPSLSSSSSFSITASTDVSRVSLASSDFQPVSLSNADGTVAAYSLTIGHFDKGDSTTLVQSGDVALDQSRLDRARELVINNPGSSGTVAADLQSAVLATILPAAITGPLDAGSRAMIRTIEHPTANQSVLAPPDSYDTGVDTSLSVLHRHLKSVDLQASVVDLNGAGLPNKTVVLFEDGRAKYARTTDADGLASFTRILRPIVDDVTFQARVSDNLPAGTVVELNDGRYLIIAEGSTLSSISTPLVKESKLDPNAAKQMFEQQGLSALLSTTGIVLILAVAVIIFSFLGFVVLIFNKILFTRKGAGVVAIVCVALGVLIVQVNKQSTPLERPTLPGKYAGHRPKQIHLADVKATSTYPPNKCAGCNFEISKALDGSLKSAWVSAPDVNQGQSIRIDLGKVMWVSEIRIANGDQSTLGSYFGNGRIQSLGVFTDGGYFTPYVFTPETPQSLNHYVRPGMTTITLPVPNLTRYLVIQMSRYTPGWYNVGVSEMQIWGFPATGRQADLQQCTAVGFPGVSLPCA